MKNTSLNRNAARLAGLVLALLGSAIEGRAEEERDYLQQVQRLGLPSLEGQMRCYYSDGARPRAEKLKAIIDDMNAFFETRVGIRADVTLAVLDPSDWKKVGSFPYGLPWVDGNPLVILMPATSGGVAFQLVVARKDAIPPEVLSAFLDDNHTTFEATADQFVDLIGFHELGHVLTLQYGIDPPAHFLAEFLATYFSYTYLSEHQPELRRVFELLGRPSKVRPKHTSLEDFERLYTKVDDYGWYQGMFEVHARELDQSMGLRFVDELRREFPASSDSATERATDDEAAKLLSPPIVLERLEKIAPGFRAWARGFDP